MAEPASIVVRKRVAWHDTDASGWYHNTAPLRMIEEAENELLDRLGILHEVVARIPRVHLEIDFRKTLRFWDEVDVEVAVAEVGEASTTFAFAIRRGPDVCAEGRYVTVRVRGEGEAEPWPEDQRRLLLGSGRQAAAPLAPPPPPGA